MLGFGFRALAATERIRPHDPVSQIASDGTRSGRPIAQIMVADTYCFVQIVNYRKTGACQLNNKVKIEANRYDISTLSA
jgi:glutamate formiminotransferase